METSVRCFFFKGKVTTCVELTTDRERRAASREACEGITPRTVDEVIDLILRAARGKAPGEDGITAEVPGAGGRPMVQLSQPLFAGVCLQRALPIVWKVGIMATIPSGKKKTTGVMLDDHVGEIFGRWVKTNILQIEPLLVTRLQAIGSARRGAVMAQFATRVFFDVARICGLSAAAVFFVSWLLPTTVW